MKTLRKLTPHGRCCTCGYTVNDIERTQPNLAMTPAQVKQLTERGVPVSTGSLPEYYADSEGWSIDPVFSRGADLNSLWETEHISQSRVLEARKRDKTIYGVRESM